MRDVAIASYLMNVGAGMLWSSTLLQRCEASKAPFYVWTSFGNFFHLLMPTFGPKTVEDCQIHCAEESYCMMAVQVLLC